MHFLGMNDKDHLYVKVECKGRQHMMGVIWDDPLVRDRIWIGRCCGQSHLSVEDSWMQM